MSDLAMAPYSWPLTLRMPTFPIDEVDFGRRTALEGRRLVIDRNEAIRVLRRDPKIAEIDLQLARPGESCRIVHVLDAVEPRTKLDPTLGPFPGFIGPVETAGWGVTCRLSGIAVLSSGQFADRDEGTRAREAIVDVAGPAASFSPFARITNVVVGANAAPGVPDASFDHAVRMATLRLADYLARSAIDRRPAEETTYALGSAPPDLPRVVHICQLMTLGVLQDSYLYGQRLHGMLPVALHPFEVIDGALVSGKFHFASNRPATYIHQNQPVVEELVRRHGKEIAFRGVILAIVGGASAIDKRRSVSQVVKLAHLLGADGAVVSQEGGGHGAVDVMMITEHCEATGIRTVLSINEMAGEDGTDFGLAYFSPAADAVVSNGNREQIIRLPAVERVVGVPAMLDDGCDPFGELQMPLREIFCSVNQLGYGALTAVGV